MRPSFTKLSELLDELLAKDSDYMDLDGAAASMDGVKPETVQSNVSIKKSKLFPVI